MPVTTPTDARAILDFWFLPAEDPGHGQARREWFRKDAAFDAEIAQRFGALVSAALAGELCDWDETAHGALARILLLDQFTRNMFRGTSRAFAGDALALAAAEQLVAGGAHRLLTPLERWFTYLPFEHAESLPVQQRSLALFAALNADGAFAEVYDYAVRHHDVIRRFGRFPHRNAILRRVSTPEEEEFLRQPGSSF